MQYRTLGRTGLKVSELGFGAWAIGGNQHGNSYGSTDDATSVAAVTRAVEQGCNFFDTADVYGFGHSEELLAQGLQEAGKLNDVIIATKVGGNFYSGKTVTDFSTGYVKVALEQTLRRLKRDYIDLYQLHNPSRPFIENGQIFEVMEELKAAGKIRHYGVSIHTVAEGLACIKNGKPDTIQIVWNMFSLSQSENPAEDLFPLALEKNIGVIAREPLANGFLAGTQRMDTQYEPGDIRATWPVNYRSYKIRLAENLRFLERRQDSGQEPRSMAQAAIRFALDAPAVSTVICGMKTAQQVDENFYASSIAALTSEEREKINRVFFG